MILSQKERRERNPRKPLHLSISDAVGPHIKQRARRLSHSHYPTFPSINVDAILPKVSPILFVPPFDRSSSVFEEIRLRGSQKSILRRWPVLSGSWGPCFARTGSSRSATPSPLAPRLPLSPTWNFSAFFRFFCIQIDWIFSNFLRFFCRLSSC